jgi:hypothetical protein
MHAQLEINRQAIATNGRIPSDSVGLQPITVGAKKTQILGGVGATMTPGDDVVILQHLSGATFLAPSSISLPDKAAYIFRDRITCSHLLPRQKSVGMLERAFLLPPSPTHHSLDVK